MKPICYRLKEKKLIHHPYLPKNARKSYKQNVLSLTFLSLEITRMVQKVKKTNPLLIHLINELKKQSLEKEAPIWKDIALRLEKSNQNWAEVNLNRISTYIHDKETALVPGKVLSTGILTKKVTIAAWSFSDKAIDKIKKAGGTSISIEELMKKNPDGKNIRIMG